MKRTLVRSSQHEVKLTGTEADPTWAKSFSLPPARSAQHSSTGRQLLGRCREGSQGSAQPLHVETETSCRKLPRGTAGDPAGQPVTRQPGKPKGLVCSALPASGSPESHKAARATALKCQTPAPRQCTITRTLMALHLSPPQAGLVGPAGSESSQEHPPSCSSVHGAGRGPDGQGAQGPRSSSLGLLLLSFF